MAENETPQNLIAVAKATDRRGKNRLPPAIPDPAGIARDYRSVIRAMVDAYAKEVDDLLTPTIESALSERGDSIRTDSWIDRLRSALSGVWERTLGRRRDAERAIKEIGEDVVSHNQKGFKRQIQATLGVDVTLNEPWLSDELEAWAAANSTLVSSVAEEAHQRVSRMAIDGVRQGRSVRDIQKDLNHQFGLSKNRAQVIARTETAKLNSELSERRQKEVGINTYYWQTSRDERVRGDHRAMNGKLCRWDDPSVYSDDGGETWKSRGSIGGVEVHPGRDFQCRCTSRPNTEEVLRQL